MFPFVIAPPGPQVITWYCPHCHSERIVKNGHNPQGKQQYRCRQCGKSGVLSPSVRYTAERKAQILAAYYERPSLRGIERAFGVARETVAAWLRKSQAPPSYAESPFAPQVSHARQVDER